MTRRPDWEWRLSAYMERVGRVPHSYGRHDCMLFVAGAVRAVTAHDPARGHRGKYRSAASASRYLKSLGFDSPAAMVASVLEEVPVALARRGDVVADREGIPGVCLGAKAAFVGMEGEREGLITRPTLDCSRAWRVGE